MIYSLEVNKAANPRMGLYYKNVTRAEATGDNEVTFYFDVKNNRELPMIMGQLTILPKHYWTGKDASGNQRDPMKTTLEPPLGSGPYRIKEVKPGRSISLRAGHGLLGQGSAGERRAMELRRDPLRILPRRDRRLRELQGGQPRLLAGDERQELGHGLRLRRRAQRLRQAARRCRSSARSRCSASCSICGARNSQDRRVRQAFNLAFDFEWANKNLFYDQYARVGSYFEGGELAAPQTLPEGRELEILNEVKDGVPPEVFTEVHANPVNDTPDDMRSNLRKAVEAAERGGMGGQERRADQRARPASRCRSSSCSYSPLFERIVQPYVRNLERLGIKGTIRMVDSAQYTRRLNGFDYDIVVGNFAQSDSPGNEQRDFWGSESADREGSTNLIGVKSPAIDKLIDHVIFAKDRAELVAATHALDRVLLWNDFVVPQWYSPNVRIAYWDRYGQPKQLPGLTPGFLQVWWFDQTLAERAAGAVATLMRRRPVHGGRSLAAQPSLLALLATGRPPLRGSTASRPSATSPTPPISTHFAYANPDAPKGGTFSLIGWGGVTTFNSLNNYILKGDAAQGLELLFDSLMVAGGRRARRGLWAGGRERRGRRRRQVGDLLFAARGEVRRRHAAHRRRRGVLLRHAEEQRPPDLSIRRCKTWSRPRRSTRTRCATASPAISCATCR